MESRHQEEVNALSEKCARDQQELQAVFEKERERLATRHAEELERRRRTLDATERKLERALQAASEKELKQLQTHLKEELRTSKESYKRELSEQAAALSRRARDEQLGKRKSLLLEQQALAEMERRECVRRQVELRVAYFKRLQLLYDQLLRREQLGERIDKKAAQEEQLRTQAAEAAARSEELQRRQLSAFQQLRAEHQHIQHETERENQRAYNAKKELDLRRKHEFQHRQLPKLLRQREAQIRKQLDEAIRTQLMQFKCLKQQRKERLNASRASRDEKQQALAALREQKHAKIQSVRAQYEQSIQEVKKLQNLKLDDTSRVEKETLLRSLSDELQLLIASQNRAREQLDAQSDRERRALDEKLLAEAQRRRARTAEVEHEMREARRTQMNALEEKFGVELRGVDDEATRRAQNASQLPELTQNALLMLASGSVPSISSSAFEPLSGGLQAMSTSTSGSICSSPAARIASSSSASPQFPATLHSDALYRYLTERLLGALSSLTFAEGGVPLTQMHNSRTTPSLAALSSTPTRGGISMSASVTLSHSQPQASPAQTPTSTPVRHSPSESFGLSASATSATGATSNSSSASVPPPPPDSGSCAGAGAGARLRSQAAARSHSPVSRFANRKSICVVTDSAASSSRMAASAVQKVVRSSARAESGTKSTQNPAASELSDRRQLSRSAQNLVAITLMDPDGQLQANATPPIQ